MTGQTYTPTGYPQYTNSSDALGQKLAKGSKAVRTFFDVVAVIVLIVGAIATVGLLIAAASEHSSYQNDYYNYTDETGSLVVAAILAPVYTAFVWASVKFYAIVAGYVQWRTSKVNG